MTSIIADYPAYIIVENRPNWRGQIVIRANEVYAIRLKKHYRTGDQLWAFVTAGSAASYAIANDECPVAGYARAKNKGHKTHWLNTNATVLSANPGPKTTHKEIIVGQIVVFEGRYFKVERAPNDNWTLTEQDPVLT